MFSEGGRYRLFPGKWIQIYPEGSEKSEKVLGPFKIIWRSEDEQGDCLFMDRHLREIVYHSKGQLEYPDRKKKLKWYFDIKILSNQETIALLKKPERFQMLQTSSIEILKSTTLKKQNGFVFDQNDPTKIIHLKEKGFKRKSVQLIRNIFNTLTQKEEVDD